MAVWKRVALPLQLYHRGPEVERRCFQQSEGRASTLHVDEVIYAESSDKTAIPQAGMPSGVDREDTTLHTDSTKTGQEEKGPVCLNHADT